MQSKWTEKWENKLGGRRENSWGGKEEQGDLEEENKVKWEGNWFHRRTVQAGGVLRPRRSSHDESWVKEYSLEH